DLGFCGPADKPLGSIYGNLPYIAPEVIAGKETTFSSDIYSVAMLMWEISSGQPPFANYGHDYYLAMNIVNGMRPKIISGTPLKYKELMQQCWNADPAKRPNIETIWFELAEINKSYYHNQQTNDDAKINNLQLNLNLNIDSTNSINSFIRNFNSKIYNFKNLPEPRNATQEEHKAYRSIQHELSIPADDIMLENKSKQDYLKIPVGNDKENNKSKRIYSDISDENEKEGLIAKSKKLRLNNDEVGYRYIHRNYITSNGKSEVYNNPNLHSEDQNGLEILEDEF
ncbi:kinase-like domain-containing protein, partial [Glomus cerebriforme]